MKGFMIAALMLALSESADGTRAATATKDESLCEGGDAASCRYIVQATRVFTGMLTTSDPAPMRRHLDPRALWISTTGAVRPGEQLIQSISRDSPRATATLDHVNVRFFEEVAVVTWSESWTAPDAAIQAGRLAGVDTWARRRGRWMVIATAEVRAPL